VEEVGSHLPGGFAVRDLSSFPFTFPSVLWAFLLLASILTQKKTLIPRASLFVTHVFFGGGSGAQKLEKGKALTDDLYSIPYIHQDEENSLASQYAQWVELLKVVDWIDFPFFD
jgi:hypothetical protein